MEHNEIKDKLFEYLDNELSNNEKVKIREHLDKCNECSEYFTKIKKLLSGINKVQKNNELPSDSYFDMLSNVIIQQLPDSPDSKLKKYFSFLFKKELSAVAVMTFVLIFIITFRYFISDSIVPLSVDKDEREFEYNEYLAPTDFNRSVPISTDENISTRDEEIIQATVSEQPLECLQEQTEQLRDASVEITCEETGIEYYGVVGEDLVRAAGGYGGITSGSSLTSSANESSLPVEGVADNFDENNFYQIEEEIIANQIEEVQTETKDFRKNFEYLSMDSEIYDSVDGIIIQLSLDDNGNVYKINFSEGSINKEDSNIILLNFIGKNFISSDSVITINLFKKEIDSLNTE